MEAMKNQETMSTKLAEAERQVVKKEENISVLHKIIIRIKKERQQMEEKFEATNKDLRKQIEEQEGMISKLNDQSDGIDSGMIK